LNSLQDNIDSLKISISTESGEVIVLQFNDHLAYRCRNEGDALNTLSQILITGGLGHTIYEVRDSEFIRWFLDDRTYECEGLRHFCLLTLNWLVDVIALSPPEVDED
jgi:hypothetical protein